MHFIFGHGYKYGIRIMLGSDCESVSEECKPLAKSNTEKGVRNYGIELTFVPCGRTGQRRNNGMLRTGTQESCLVNSSWTCPQTQLGSPSI